MSSSDMIRIENLVKRYQDLVALDHLTLSIQEGEIFGLLGPNGSGKTTAINCMLALLKYDKGSITVFGRNMQPDSYDIKKQIGVVMQNVAVFEQMSVQENIDYFCGLYIRDKAKRQSLTRTPPPSRTPLWKRPSHLPDLRITGRCAPRSSQAVCFGGLTLPAASSTNQG